MILVVLGGEMYGGIDVFIGVCGLGVECFIGMMDNIEVFGFIK